MKRQLPLHTDMPLPPHPPLQIIHPNPIPIRRHIRMQVRKRVLQKRRHNVRLRQRRLSRQRRSRHVTHDVQVDCRVAALPRGDLRRESA